MKQNFLASRRLHSGESSAKRRYNSKMCMALENANRSYEKYGMKNGAEFIIVIKARKFSCKDKRPYEQRNGFPFLKAFV